LVNATVGTASGTGRHCNSPSARPAARWGFFSALHRFDDVNQKIAEPEAAKRQYVQEHILTGVDAAGVSRAR
jgi:hypothetical protein